MESDLANPAAEQWDDVIEATAVEMAIQPQAVFADMTIRGSFDGARVTAGDVATDTAIAAATAPASSKWVLVLVVAVIAIAGVALWNQQKG